MRSGLYDAKSEPPGWCEKRAAFEGCPFGVMFYKRLVYKASAAVKARSLSSAPDPNIALSRAFSGSLVRS